MKTHIQKWMVYGIIGYEDDILLSRFDSEKEAQEFADKLCCGYEISKVLIG